VQLNELGLLESPIALTNTFAVGTIYTAIVRHAVDANPAIGRTAPTLNPVVAECNDGWLNDLQRFAVQEAHYAQAFDAAAADFAQGAVGAGRGMSCFGVKGGIGSASRTVQAGVQQTTLGALVLANFGRPAALTVRGIHLGRLLTRSGLNSPADGGSIIIVLATDARLDHRQLRRIAMRAAAGLARTGSSFGHGSGDIAIAFASSGDSTRAASARSPAASNLPDDALDPLFDAAAEATEQAIVHALFSAQTVTGHAGHVRHALTERIPDWRARFADTR
jgi:D-aminopeptidase